MPRNAITFSPSGQALPPIDQTRPKDLLTLTFGSG